VIEFAVVALGISAFVAAGLTPVARWAARRADLVAEPRPDRLHDRPIPYGGGVALADTLTLVVGGAWLLGLYAPADWLPTWLPPDVRAHLDARTPVLVRLAAGALVFVLIGLLDDFYDLRALPKFALQAVGAAFVVVGLGLAATVWTEAEWMGRGLSILWLLAVVNATNMFDHADGMAAGVGIVAFASLAVGQMLMGEWFVPGVALAAAGALAGFLIYNWPPATVFLGDAGSHLVGYLFGALAMVARYYFPEQGTTRWVVAVPVLIFLVPLFDMVRVFASRAIRVRNPFVGDATSHLAHRMLACGARPATPVLAAAGLTVVAGLGATILYFPRPLVTLVLPIVLVVLAAMVYLRRKPEREEADA
jgi:UDP-GlcNAc:undecaprenyl-phosphate GlcNAc-1-phosphate transferase